MSPLHWGQWLLRATDVTFLLVTFSEEVLRPKRQKREPREARPQAH